MDLRDWIGLAGNCLWVVGLALCLATLSLAHYQARTDRERTWNWLKRPGSQLALAIGGSLFCVGLVLVGESLWEKVIWGLCAVTLIVWAVRSWRSLGAREGGR